jgi:glucose-6-phosphate 1-dehydrogenase
MLQLLSLVAMEPPHSLHADVIRDEKLEVLQSLRPLTQKSVDSCVVRGQYAAGVLDGRNVPGYREESGVASDSRTETFIALQAFIDNWRWAGVPFFLRTGKRLPKRASAITIQLKDVPPILFNADGDHRLDPNVLTIRIQPNEGFSLGISSKVPGPKVRITPVAMDFDYCEFFRSSSPEAYERLLLDVMIGDATLFMRRDSVEASWHWITPILERWGDRADAPLPTYAPGEWGPPEAQRLIEKTGRHWRMV